MLNLTLVRAWTVSVALLTCVGCVGAPEGDDQQSSASNGLDPTTAVVIGEQPTPAVVPVVNDEALLTGAENAQDPDLDDQTAVAHPNDEMLRDLTPCGDGFCPPEMPKCILDHKGQPGCI